MLQPIIQIKLLFNYNFANSNLQYKYSSIKLKSELWTPLD